jgi:hypothetical protein
VKKLLFPLLCLVVVGCGGSSDPRFQKEHLIETVSATGTLRGVLVNPAPGSYSLDPDTRFEVYWPEGSMPPASFTVSLIRYEEGYSHSGYDSSGSSTTDKVGPEHKAQLSLLIAGTNHWQVIPKKSLERGGLYYLELTSGSDTWRTIFRIEE